MNMQPWNTGKFRKSISPYGISQRRTFLGLQRTPAPNPRVMGYLVFQGLAVVLLADMGFATLLDHPSVTRKVAQSMGIWKEEPSFETRHNTHPGK